MEQIPLFQDAFMLMNDAAAALKALRPAAALEALECYRELYGSSADWEKKIKIGSFLNEGLSAAPRPGADLPSYLFTLWNSFKTFCRSHDPDGTIVDELRLPFFQKIAIAIDEAQLADSAFLAGEIPVGYVYLQTGAYDRAIRSLQACLTATPDNGAIYGYLGDAYWMRGDREVARQVYFEACLIDPAALDWRHLRDDELKYLREQLPEEYDGDQMLACAWLPACAYVRGLFRPKQIRHWEEFQNFVNSYLELKKTSARTSGPALTARLFFQGIILCDNEPFLRMFKGIDFAEVRREMKAANPALFADYLKQIERRRKKGL